MTKLWKTISAFTLVAALFLGLPGCGGETAQRETTPSTAEEQLDLPFANVVSSRDEGWLVEPAQDTVTLPLEDNRTLEFTKVQDHSAADSSQWTDSALITCYDANEDVIWKIETDTVKGWDLSSEDITDDNGTTVLREAIGSIYWETGQQEISWGPYVPYGIAGDKFFFANLGLPLEALHSGTYNREGKRFSISAIDLSSGKIVWETALRGLNYYNPINICSGSQGMIGMSIGDSVICFDADGEGLYQSMITINEGFVWSPNTIISDLYEEENEYYIKAYTMQHGQWTGVFDETNKESMEMGYGTELKPYGEEPSYWKEAYVGYLEYVSKNVTTNLLYQVAYIDDDFFPDLIIYNTLSQDANVYFGEKGTGSPLGFGLNTLRYIEYESSWSVSSIVNNEVIFKIIDGVELVKAKKTVSQFGAKYELEDKEVSEEEFYDRLTEVFDPSQAKELDLRQGYTADEMLEIIENM